MDSVQADGKNTSGMQEQSTLIVPSGDDIRRAEAYLAQSIARARENIAKADGGDERYAPIGDALRERLKELLAETPENVAIRVEEDKRQRQTEQRERITREREGDWQHFISNRPRYAQATLATFEAITESQIAAVATLQDYCRNVRKYISNGVGIVCIGPSGTGKDHLLTAVLRAAIIYGGFHCEWTSGAMLWQTMRDNIGEQCRERDIIKHMVSRDVFAVSDPALRGHPITEFQADVLYRVVDERYSRNKPTFISANVKGRGELEELIGVAVVDRLTDNAIVISCDWPSYRKPARKV